MFSQIGSLNGLKNFKRVESEYFKTCFAYNYSYRSTMTVKHGVLSIAEYLSCFLIYLMTTVGLHEFLHLSVLRQLGGDGYIVLHPLGGGGVVYTHFPTAANGELIVLFSGGILVFVIYTIFALWNYKDENYEELAALVPIALMQLFYGLYEGVFKPTLSDVNYVNYASIPAVLGFGIGLAFPIKHRGKWVPLFYALVAEFVYQFDRVSDT